MSSSQRELLTTPCSAASFVSRSPRSGPCSRVFTSVLGVNWGLVDSSWLIELCSMNKSHAITGKSVGKVTSCRTKYTGNFRQRALYSSPLYRLLLIPFLSSFSFLFLSLSPCLSFRSVHVLWAPAWVFVAGVTSALTSKDRVSELQLFLWTRRKKGSWLLWRWAL